MLVHSIFASYTLKEGNQNVFNLNKFTGLVYVPGVRRYLRKFYIEQMVYGQWFGSKRRVLSWKAYLIARVDYDSIRFFLEG